MLRISQKISIPLSDLDISFVRAGGPGGQNVNKVSSAVHLRFDINASSLPDYYKQRLLKRHDQRITADGVVVIKAQKYRRQEQNRQDALLRLRQLLVSAGTTQRRRIPTKPSQGVLQRRRDSKKRWAKIKQLRKKVEL